MKVVTMPNSLTTHKKELDKRLKYYADNRLLVNIDPDGFKLRTRQKSVY